MSSSDLSTFRSECALCAARNITIQNLKRINKLCLGCLCILGFGTAGLSAFFAYKYWKIKKLVADLENNVDNLTLQLEFLKASCKEKKLGFYPGDHQIYRLLLQQPLISL